MSGLPAVLAQVEHQAVQLGNLVRALELLGQSWPVASEPEARFHLRRMARWVAAQLEPEHDPPRLLARVGLPADLWPAVGAPAAAARRAPRAEGAVETVLLDADHGGEGFVAQVVVGQRCAGPARGATFEQAVERAQRAVLEHFLRRGEFIPSRAVLQASHVQLEGPRATRWFHADGSSVGAAAAVALFARWSGQAAPRGVLVTGRLGPGGEVLPVAGMEAKRAAALRERPGLRLLLVPAGQGSDSDARLEEVAHLEQLLGRAFDSPPRAVAPAPELVDLEGTVRLGVELYEKQGAFSLAAELLCSAREVIGGLRQRRGQPALYRVEQLQALWREGSARIHLGQTERAAGLLREARQLAEQLWQAHELDPRIYLGVRGNLAVLLRDQWDHAGAEALLLENLAIQRGLHQDRREVAKTLGNLGELYTFVGRFAEAEQCLLQALEALRALYPDEVPRELCYLGNAYLRQGELELARASYDEGLRENRRVAYGAARNAAFLHYGLARVMLAQGQAARAVAHADRGLAHCAAGQIYPGQMLRKVRGVACWRRGEQQLGERELRRAADPRHARGALARLAVATAGGELARLWLERGWDGAVVELVQPLAAAARQVGPDLWPAHQQRRLQQALERQDAAATGAALGTLLERFPY